MSTALIEVPQADIVVGQLRIYQARTVMTLSDVARAVGLAPRTLMRFACGRDYGNGSGEAVAERVAAFMAANPAPLPIKPGRLYENSTTRLIDALILHCKHGGWGTLYGPAGSQKSFCLEYRAAEAAALIEPDLVLIQGEARMTPRTLLGRIAQGLGAGYAQSAEGIRQGIFAAVRRRKTHVAIAIDEAQLLYHSLDTLETLRRLADQLPTTAGRTGVGILVAGNERILRLFEVRHSNYFEQWRSRIGQKQVKAVRPVREQAREMIVGELGRIPESAIARALDDSTAADPIHGREYINLRTLFQIIEFARRRMEN
jgi:type II secretory pathway predicted ATPase ExeA